MSHDDTSTVRSSAEWVTFAVSLAVLVLVVVLLVVDVDRDEPARPVLEVQQEQIDAHDGTYDVPVVVRNDGGRAAANVQVLAELTTTDGTLEAEQSVDFLGVGESARLVFVFGSDPAAGQLRVSVGSFAVP